MTTTWPQTTHCSDQAVDPRWFDVDATPIQRYHAQQTCIGCPAAKTCLQYALEQHLPGYYAGQLITRTGDVLDVTVNPYAADARTATTAELTAAHRRHSSGHRDDLTVALNREYDRRRYLTKRYPTRKAVEALTGEAITR